MGNTSSSSSSSTWGNFVSNCFFKPKHKERGLFCHGLDAAGETTVLHRLALLCQKEVITTIPTIGFNVETIHLKGTGIIAWDVGGRSGMRDLWRRCMNNVDGLIFVVDSNGAHRMEQARDKFWRMVSKQELQKCPLLLFCDKQDPPNARPPSKIAEFFNVNKVGVKVKAFRRAAIERQGLWEGLKWLVQAIETAQVGDQDDQEETEKEIKNEDCVARHGRSWGLEDTGHGAGKTRHALGWAKSKCCTAGPGCHNGCIRKKQRGVEWTN